MNATATVTALGPAAARIAAPGGYAANTSGARVARSSQGLRAEARHDTAASSLASRAARVAWAAGVALAGAHLPAAGSDSLTPFAARLVGHKRVAMLDAKAQAMVELRKVHEHYVFSLHTTVRVAVLERRFYDCALLRERHGRLEPVEYVHIDESDPRHSVHTRYDWAGSTATTVRGNSAQSLSAPLSWPTWDPVSLQAAMIALARQRQPGSSEVHQLLSKGVLDDLRLDFVGPLPAGAPGGAPGLATWKLTTTKPSGTNTVLLAPEHGWLPYRITIDEVTLEWDGRGLPAPPPAGLGVVPRCRLPGNA